MPDKFLVGMTYGDHNVENYIWSEGSVRHELWITDDSDIILIYILILLFLNKTKKSENFSSIAKNDNILLFKNKNLLKYIAFVEVLLIILIDINHVPNMIGDR